MEKLLVTSNFSFSHSVFKRLVSQAGSKGVIVWEWVEDNNFNVTQNTELVFHSVENIMEKGENANYQHYIFHHHVFKWLFLQASSQVIPKLSSANAFKLGKFLLLSFG